MPISWARILGFGAVLSAPCIAIAQSNRGADPLSPFAEQKAALLLRDRLPCLGCHRLDGEGGTTGPDLTTVRERRSAGYIAAMVADPQGTVPGSAMPRTLMPESTRDLIVRYLASRPGAAGPGGDAAPGTVPPAPPATAPDAPALYARWCAPCHGTAGRGDGPNAANLPVRPAAHSSREAMSSRPDDSLYDTIAAGGAVMNRSPRMPAFGATLSPAEIRSLVRHIRSLCRCEAPAWSRDPGRGGR